MSADKCRHFRLTPHTPNAPTTLLDVVASVWGDCLQLSYFIDPACQDKFAKPSDDALTQVDFLWETTCLECFFDVGQDAYFELNFTPSGKYNLYHFDGYRTPNTLPPRRADGMVFVVRHADNLPHLSHHLGIKLTNIHSLSIGKISPTAIIYDDGAAPYFYAVKHKDAPDFHDKAYWQRW